MRRYGFKLAALAVTTIASCVGALAQSPNPTCQRLEAQLASLDRGNSDPARADQIRRAEDAVNRQQFEVDRLVAQSRRMGCESSGFFSIFSNPPPQCGGLSRQIDQQRNALERQQNQLEQLSGGTTERAAQRQSLLVALGDNGCGAQYRSAALAGQQGGFFDRLFGGNGGSYSAPAGQMGGTFRTICVRTCDGFYFPISYATTPDRFRDDEQTCQHMCPAAEVSLYMYHNTGEEVTRRSRSTAGSTPNCRQRSATARRLIRYAVVAGRAKAGLRRSRSTEPTTQWRRATSLSPSRTPSGFHSRASVPTASRSVPIRARRRPRLRRRKRFRKRPARPIRPSEKCARSARPSCRCDNFSRSRKLRSLPACR